VEQGYTIPDRIIRFVGEHVSWLCFGLVLLICVDVLFRYLFHFSVAWMTELEWHFFGLIFLLGSPYALEKDKHVRVDLFYAKFGKREKAQVNVVGTLVFLIPWSFTMCWFSVRYAFESFRIRESSPDPGGLPALYPIKMAMALGFALLFLQGLMLLQRQLKIAISRNPS